MASLLRGFADSVTSCPDRAALHLDDRIISYQELAAFAGSLASAIVEEEISQQGMVALLASESLTAYAGIPAILGARRGFVPVDPAHPPRRILEAIDHCGADTVVVGPGALDRLDGLLEQIGRPLAIIAPETTDLRGVAARHPRHRYRAGAAVMSLPPGFALGTVSPQDPAYLLYTSGSTGSPRGVVVNRGNLKAYLKTMNRRFPVVEGDRCSHTFPLTFDLSIHDLLTTWSAGATLYAWGASRRAEPSRFVANHRLTRWFSIPTVAMTMERLGELKPGQFPSLRKSFFCGEPLPTSVAHAWQKAAPNSSVINLYGPTETTVAIAAHCFEATDEQGSEGEEDGEYCRRDVVPLGELFDGQQAMIVDSDGTPVEPGVSGELLLSGSQVTDGYLRAPEATERQFIKGDDGRVWFRTGDLVECDEEGCMHFLGRLDDQIKLRGHHVELSAVDRALRRACGHEMALCVPWPRDHTGVYGLVALVATDEPLDTRHLMAGCRRYLPNSMVPDRIVGLRSLPRNDRGKLDRQAMQRLLQHREV